MRLGDLTGQSKAAGFGGGPCWTWLLRVSWAGASACGRVGLPGGGAGVNPSLHPPLAHLAHTPQLVLKDCTFDRESVLIANVQKQLRYGREGSCHREMCPVACRCNPREYPPGWSDDGAMSSMKPPSPQTSSSSLICIQYVNAVTKLHLTCLQSSNCSKGEGGLVAAPVVWMLALAQRVLVLREPHGQSETAPCPRPQPCPYDQTKC